MDFLEHVNVLNVETKFFFLVCVCVCVSMHVFVSRAVSLSMQKLALFVNAPMRRLSLRSIPVYSCQIGRSGFRINASFVQVDSGCGAR